ncbi:Tetrachloroethene reductive dehalogenase TceA membrane-bound subunit [Dehalococcoides mccartyi]|uniref:Tetrachloroethene reductive dehalogenase TceA membrane-bound subunit n=1 Tax=Dehalococcoides mccartyi TaxID=61435 RepID=A0A328EL04_9CHLR|nr:Tetrachloroethene reductive dehalogenase TceA membrane-bound subunit [Dehalococcoides mccartyi]
MVRLIIGILLGLWGLPVLVFSIQNLIGSLSETEPQAAGMFFAVTGLPALVMLLGAFLLIRSYLKNPSKPAHPVQSRLSTADSQNTSVNTAPNAVSDWQQMLCSAQTADRK